MLVMCVTYTLRNGYQWGLQIASGLFSWVPRSLWPGKGVGTGHMVSDALGFEFTNLAPPIVSEPIVDFGLLGVLPFAALVGWLFSKLDQVYWSASHTRQAPVRVIDVMLPFWLGLAIMVTRGDFIAANAFILGFTLWIVPMGLGARRPAARVASEEGGVETARTVGWGGGSFSAAPPGPRT
jgi:hypothetical protein